MRYVHTYAALYADRLDAIDLDDLEARARADQPRPALAYSTGAHATALLGSRAPSAADAFDLAAAHATESGHTHMRCLHRSYASYARAGDDPQHMLHGLRVALATYGEAGLPFGPRQVAGDCLGPLAVLGRWTTIAALDGAAPPVSIFPQVALQAKRAARATLGPADYEAAVARGRALSHRQFATFLTGELDELGVRREP